MRKCFLFFMIPAIVVIISCSKKTVPQSSNVAEPEKKSASVTYAAHVKQLVESKCTPCHIPSKGGNKTALDNFDNAKKLADEIVRRIGLAPGEKGFMPFRNDKLSDEEIAVFTKWLSEGSAEN